MRRDGDSPNRILVHPSADSAAFGAVRRVATGEDSQRVVAMRFSEELTALATAVNLLSQQVARFDAKLDTRNGAKLLKQFRKGVKRGKRKKR